MSDVPALLLIGCSRRKAAGLQRGRAWDIYDGPLFQVLKKALRNRAGWERQLTVLIISAKHGVLRSDRVISTYDEQLTPRVAGQRGARFALQLRSETAGRRFRAVHINLGRLYRSVLPDLDDLFAPLTVDWASGGIGVRNAATRRWVLGQLGDLDVPVSGGTAGPQSCPPELRTDSRHGTPRRIPPGGRRG